MNATRHCTTRKQLWKELAWRKPMWGLGILVLFLSTADWAWDELFEPRGVKRWKLIEFIRLLPWYGWLILGLVGMIFMFVEHAHTLISKAEDEAESLRNPEFTFKLSHEDTQQTFSNGQVGIHRRIVVENDSDDTAKNCELVVENTSLSLLDFTRNSALPVKDGKGAFRANIHQRSTVYFDLFVTYLFSTGVLNGAVPQGTHLCTTTWPCLPLNGTSQEKLELRLSGDNFSTRRFQISLRRNGRDVELDDFNLQL